MPTTVFRNVRVFPGHGDALLPGHDVTVDGTTIASLVPHGPAARPADGAVTIEGGGRTLMPGLIDAHWHAASTSVDPVTARGRPVGSRSSVAARPAGVGAVVAVQFA